MAVRVVLVCKSLQQIRRSCGRSETLSLDAVVMNILACFRSEAYRCFSAFGNFMNLASSGRNGDVGWSGWRGT